MTIRQIISEACGYDPDTVTGEMTLRQIGFDSVDMMICVQHLEEEMGRELTEEESERLTGDSTIEEIEKFYASATMGE